LSRTKVIHVVAGAPAAALTGRSGLHPAGRRLLRLPGLRSLRPCLHRALAVAEPPGRLSFRAFPSRQAGDGCAGLTVLSANLWHDWPRHRRLPARLESFARLVETQRADIVLLQEVARTPDLWADEWLGERLGMAYVYSRANGHAGGIGFEEGLAVFSRFPLADPRLQQLGGGRNPFVRRLGLGAAVATPCGEMLAFSVHLGLRRRQNAAQLAHLRAWVSGLAGSAPALVGGDFNAPETSLQISRAQTAWVDTFRRLHPQADGATHELRWPWGGLIRRARLDYIFLHLGSARWQVLEARHLATEGRPHSDHRAVLARLAFDQTEPADHSEI
jgi:endonuclease/exonuclease/phosphatase family metal-dependent hydrolase